MLRVGDQEFGSVFKRPGHGGPKFIHGSRYPTWSDPRRPGNTDPNMEASRIMSRWTPAQMKRFEYFMEQHNRDTTPWKREWLDKTAPGRSKQSEQIIKCKLELVKRLLKIKMTGPQSMEDWCLYFLYYDDKLDIPQNIETLIRPEWSVVNKRDWYNNIKKIDDEFPYLVRDSERNKEYTANLFLPGFEQGDGNNQYRDRYYPVFEAPRAGTRFNSADAHYFPSRASNREPYRTRRGMTGAVDPDNRMRQRYFRSTDNF